MNLKHGQDKKLLKCLGPWPYFQGHIGKETSKFRQKTVKCTFSLEWFNGLYPNLHDLKRRHDKSWCDFCDLELIIQGCIRKKSQIRLKLIKCALPSERVSGYYINLDEINIWLWQKMICEVFGTIFLFSRLHKKKLLSLGKSYLICEESADVSKFTKFVWAG